MKEQRGRDYGQIHSQTHSSRKPRRARRSKTRDISKQRLKSPEFKMLEPMSHKWLCRKKSREYCKIKLTRIKWRSERQTSIRATTRMINASLSKLLSLQMTSRSKRTK